MILVTQLNDAGIELGVFDDASQLNGGRLTAHEVPSEHYLRVLDEVVEDWSKIKEWYTRVDAESFTSIRGLVALINTLASINGIPVHVFTKDVSDAKQVELPLVPAYSSEPNIGKRN